MEGFWASHAGHSYSCVEHGITRANSAAFFPHLLDAHEMTTDEALQALRQLMQAKHRPGQYFAVPDIEVRAEAVLPGN